MVLRHRGLRTSRALRATRAALSTPTSRANRICSSRSSSRNSATVCETCDACWNNARTARTHRRIRESLKLEMISKLIPELMKSPRESREVRRVALEAVLNGLVLEYAYDPETITQ